MLDHADWPLILHSLEASIAWIAAWSPVPVRVERRTFGLGWRKAELDHIAVRIADVQRQGVALGADAVAFLLDFDMMRDEVGTDRLRVGGPESEGDVVDIATAGDFRPRPDPFVRADIDEVDQMRAGAQLAHAILGQVIVDGAANHLGVERRRPFHAVDQQHDMVEPFYRRRDGHRRTSILPVFWPVNRPRNASGVFSSPSTTVSRALTCPPAIQP